MVDAIGFKKFAAVTKIERPPKEGKKKPRQQPLPEHSESEEEKRRLGANIDERC